MKINTYENDNNISLNDKVTGTDADDANKTKNYTFQRIKDFLIAQGLGGGSSIDISGKEDTVNKSTNVATDGTSDTKYPTVKAVKTYVDANVGVGVSKTYGPITAGSVSPYPFLTFSMNTVDSVSIGDRVNLPMTSEIGKEVIVFAMNNANSFYVRCDSYGGISSGGIISSSSTFLIGPNISARFIHLGGGYWKAEII
jgi:hypothetical protein